MNEMEYTIREAVEADLEPIAGLLAELGYPASVREVERRLREVEQHPPDAVLTAIFDRQVVGFVSLHVMPYFTSGDRVCRVTALVIKEGMRGRGIGRSLMRAVERQAREVGCTAIEVTSADYRKEAHAFYERLGYPRTSVKFFKIIDPGEE